MTPLSLTILVTTIFGNKVKKIIKSKLTFQMLHLRINGIGKSCIEWISPYDTDRIFCARNTRQNIQGELSEVSIYDAIY